MATAAEIVAGVSGLFPFIGSLIAAPLSFGAMYYSLNTILNQLEATALEVICVAFSHSSDETDEYDDDDED